MDLRPFRQRNWALLDSGEPLPRQNERRLQKKQRMVLQEEYKVDRIIATKNCPNEGKLYLVQWKGYPSSDTTWEPENHIPEADLKLFHEPVADASSLQIYANLLEEAVRSRLNSRNNQSFILCPTNIYKFVFGAVGDLSVNKEDFRKLPLSKYWYAKLNVHGEGIKLDFPVKVKSVVTYKKVFLPEGNICVQKTIPIEKLVFLSSTVVCRANELF